MICPTCKLREKAEGRARCWPCLETELDACKPDWEFKRPRVSPFVPFDWTARGQRAHDKRTVGYRVDRGKR